MPEVSAVDEFRMSRSADVHRVVGHLPDATAEELVVAVNQLPVALQIPRTVAHGVAVFTEEKRELAVPVLQVIAEDVLVGRVHSAVQINEQVVRVGLDVRMTIRLNQAARQILGMNQRPGHPLVEIVRHRAVIASRSALVSDRPHQHARVVLVAFHHAARAVEVRLGPVCAVGQFVPVAR